MQIEKKTIEQEFTPFTLEIKIETLQEAKMLRRIAGLDVTIPDNLGKQYKLCAVKFLECLQTALDEYRV